MKIYIIGPPGSGKSILANKLSKKLNIKNYELDLIVYDDEHNLVQRSKQEIKEKFNKILSQKKWIIEDVGRTKFVEGLKKSDKIYYINMPKIIVYFRVIKRWFKQKIGKENYNYPPTIFQFFDMIKITNKYYRTEKEVINQINIYKEKLEYLDYKGLNTLMK